MQFMNRLINYAICSHSVKLKLSSKGAVEGRYVPVADWGNESSTTNRDENDAVAVWATQETVFYFFVLSDVTKTEDRRPKTVNGFCVFVPSLRLHSFFTHFYYYTARESKIVVPNANPWNSWASSLMQLRN